MITKINEFKKYLKNESIQDNDFNQWFIDILNNTFTKEDSTNSDFSGLNVWNISGDTSNGYYIIQDENGFELFHRIFNENDLNPTSELIDNIESTDKNNAFKFLDIAKSYITKDLNEDLMGFDKIGHISKDVTIELDLKHTQHSLGRQGRGSDYITNTDIKNAVSTATEQMVDLIIANKLNVGDSVLITRKEDRLNIVGALSLKKGTDIINFTVITCMRVENFLNKNNTLQIFI